MFRNRSQTPPKPCVDLSRNLCFHCYSLLRVIFLTVIVSLSATPPSISLSTKKIIFTVLCITWRNVPDCLLRFSWDSPFMSLLKHNFYVICSALLRVVFFTVILSLTQVIVTLPALTFKWDNSPPPRVDLSTTLFYYFMHHLG